MKFSEIENILKVPLVKEAYKYDSFWGKKGQMICQVHGFKVTNVNFCRRAHNWDGAYKTLSYAKKHSNMKICHIS